MPLTAPNTNRDASRPVQILLTGGRVTAGFREALFAAAGRAGVSVNEFVLRAAGQQLALKGADFPGVFERGDTNPQNDNFRQEVFLHG